MNLLIDQGNSRCKVAIYSDQNHVDSYILYELTTKAIQHILDTYEIHKCILASVKKIPGKIHSILHALPTFKILDSHTKIPLNNLYETPETLGNDRLAAVVGANTLFPDENLLVFDFGTAITIDFVNFKNEYLGGNIAPGMNIRFASLNTETDQLPLLKSTEKFPFIGNNTSNAIISGVQTGIIHEIIGYINYMESEYNSFKVVFTGGDAGFFVKKIKKTIFVEPNLIFIGLNKILEYNV